VFDDRFVYSTEVLELNVSKKPQLQLNAAIVNFIAEHDGPNKLMIVYYTGHGTFNEREKILTLSAYGFYLSMRTLPNLSASTTDSQALRRFMIPPRANFTDAEENLRASYIDADVLTIIDSCFSSNIQKSGVEDDRTYELLSACGLDMTTSSPGPNSFTRALIDSLKELLDECRDGSFTTFNLQQRINLHKARRDTPSFLWNRLQHHERHIRLARLRDNRARCTRALLCHPINAYLNLRLALKDPALSRDQIEKLTKDLASVFNGRGKLAVRRIDWMGIRKPARTEGFRRGALALHFFVRWRGLVARRRKRALEELGGQSSGGEEVAERSPRKKSRQLAVEPFVREMLAGPDKLADSLGTQDMAMDTPPFAPLTPASEEVVEA
jgi:hypothetical protein